VAGRFPLYTDADVHGPLVEALIRRGWDVLRAVDAFPEGTQDDLHFARAAQLERVMVSCDRDVRRLAVEWLRQGGRFRGLIAWPQEHHARMSVGEFVEEFETLASTDDPFAGYPIIHLKPSR
jgi:hypothetical protein